MGSLFEVIVQEILPTARALVAKKLIQAYGLSQKETASRLGISQPAVSQYKRELRGSRMHIFKDNPQVIEKIDEIAKRIASGQLTQDKASLEICGLYRFIKPEDFNIEEFLGV